MTKPRHSTGSTLASQCEQLDALCVEAKAKGNMVAIVAAKVKARGSDPILLNCKTTKSTRYFSAKEEEVAEKDSTKAKGLPALAKDDVKTPMTKTETKCYATNANQTRTCSTIVHIEQAAVRAQAVRLPCWLHQLTWR